MPQIPIHRKAKRATVLTKRTQYLKKYHKERSSYRPLYEKLKSNNSYLAKALSQEKQNCQSLFSQNLALIAEVQELRLACTSRDNVISNVLNNAKEMLKMLVTMSGYMTNTISICQEFTACNTNLRLSSSIGRKESIRRLSTKSPAKGVVKPMVSGHTITKPTINLSRVNMQNINNTSRLSDIQEVSTPDRSQDINEARSPIAVSIPIIQLHRYENGRTCRLPERIAVPSPRVKKDNEQRLRKRKSRSKRMSGSFSRSRSDRWSSETTRYSTEHANQLSSPTVKLNDVSKLLQNSQSINIRRLIDDNKIDDIEMHESSDDGPHNTSDKNIIIPETQLSINMDEVDEEYAQTPKCSNAQTKDKSSRKEWNKNSSASELSQNNAETWQDPLEGPSWLLDNIAISDDYTPELNHSDVVGVNSRASQSNSKVKTAYSDESSDIEDAEDELRPLPELTGIETSNKVSSIADRIKNDHSLDDDAVDDAFCAILSRPAEFNRDRNFNMIEEDDNTTNLARFVTMRRGNSSVIEETEDFTLMMSRQPARNMNFDINELRLPILEGSMINPTVVNDIDSEVTTAIQRITNFRMPSMSNQSANEPEVDLTTTIKLPLDLINDRVSSPEKNKHSNQNNKKTKLFSPRDNTSYTENAVTVNKKAKSRKLTNSQDPSTAKVVLEKLNESRVKPRTPSPDDTISQSTNNNMNNTISSSINNNTSNVSSFQERNNTKVSKSDSYTSDRPRRRKAVINFKEPNLLKKLRRNN